FSTGSPALRSLLLWPLKRSLSIGYMRRPPSADEYCFADAAAGRWSGRRHAAVRGGTMAGRSKSAYSLLLIVSQALWVLPAVEPASAQVTLPPNFISADVPHDVPTGPSASIQDLAIFAWREFIALNWVAMDPATTGIRARPNVNLGSNGGFLGIKADPNGNFPLLVWHTYRHKNELFPAAPAQTDASFDSSMPTYNYVEPLPTAAGGANFQLFNNLE